MPYSRSEANKKPKPDRAPIKKIRTCLMCSSEFQSRHLGERVCGSCKETSAWRSGGVAA